MRGWAHVSGTKEGVQPTCRQTYTDGHLQRGYNLHVQADMYRHRWMNTQPQTHLKTPTPIQEGGGGGGGGGGGLGLFVPSLVEHTLACVQSLESIKKHKQGMFAHNDTQRSRHLYVHVHTPTPTPTPPILPPLTWIKDSMFRPQTLSI